MVDLTITAASVLPGSNARKKAGTSGATIAAGKVVYLDSTTNTWLLADSDSATAAARGSTDDLGIALNGASAGQPVDVQVAGDVTLGAVMTAGVTYYLSDDPGGICPIADLATGDYYVVLGVAKSTSVLAFDPAYSGVAA
jgi:hypothetical protein